MIVDESLFPRSNQSRTSTQYAESAAIPFVIECDEASAVGGGAGKGGGGGGCTNVLELVRDCRKFEGEKLGRNSGDVGPAPLEVDAVAGK